MFGRKTVALTLTILVALITAALWIAKPPAITAREPVTKPGPSSIERGRYIALLGDCVPCHTAPDGPRLAGGRALQTPFGTLWSTNITPDDESGLGRWTFGAFDRSMRRGVSADGHRLYPAMPYPSYARMTDDDMRDLWAYLSQGVPAVTRINQPTAMGFPFNLRFGLAYWDAVFADSRPFVPDRDKDPLWNRGAYLVQGLGHCGACHTPRGIGFQERTMSDAGANGSLFVSGAQIDLWNAIDLRGLWTTTDLVEMLKTGQNGAATASGSMTEVVLHSTQSIGDDDLVAMATYLNSLSADPTRSSPQAASTHEPPTTLYTTRGGLAFVQFCIDCHRANGAGVKTVFPALAGNPTVADDDPSTLVHLMLTGWKTAATGAHPRVYTMPAFARLGDREIAEILGFVRANFGDPRSSPVTEKRLAAARASLDPRIDESKFETPRLADTLARPDAGEIVRGIRRNTETRTQLPRSVGNDLNCASCHLNAGTVADGSPYVGVAAFFPSYAPRAGKVITMAERINGCFKRSMNGSPLPPDSAEMKAMLAYFEWMKGATKPEDKVAGRGVGKIDPHLSPDAAHGREVYRDQCAACHGRDGEGSRDDAGQTVYPPLWGERSFNIGAGMARTYTAAAFVKRNMPTAFRETFPLGQGGLSDQDAVDVAEYFSHMPRPDFPDKVRDWPKDPKPKDARY